MMSVRLRLAGLLAGWLLRGRTAPPQDAGRLTMRCWPTDLDINMHMNNSRYLALMDVGRWHYILATGLWRGLRARRWVPVAARVEIDFKKSIGLGQRFRLETTCERVGTKSTTLVQRFWLGDVLAAEARVVVLFMHEGKSQALAPLMAEHPHLLIEQAVAAGEQEDPRASAGERGLQGAGLPGLDDRPGRC